MSKPTIFISHINEEKEIATFVKEFIEKKFLRTINVFSSSHEESIKLGEEWFEAIKTSLNESSLLLILCSPISVARPWINFEAGAGWVRGIPVIPLCHSGLTPGNLPVPLKTFQGITLSNKEDIKKLFSRIGQIHEISPPDPQDEAFYQNLSDFESKIKSSILYKDTDFIYTFLYKQIWVLEYSILASVRSLDELSKIDSQNFSIDDHEIKFNDVYNLYNPAILLSGNFTEKVFHLYYKTILKLDENIKFLLTNHNLQIAPSLKELLNEFLFSYHKVESSLFMIETVGNNPSVKTSMEKMIQESDLPPRRLPSNVINHFIDYYDSLIFFKNWTTNVKRIANELLHNA